MNDAYSVRLPAYGRRALADLVPALLAAQGVPGLPDPLGLPRARTVCLLLVDGLGWRQLLANADNAPFLSSLAAGAQPLTSGFPSTTAVSVASVGTGLTSGQHGIVGTSFALPDAPLLNALRWGTHLGTRHDLRERLVPEEVQPLPTMFDRAVRAGVEVSTTAPALQRGSGLSRAVLRGARFQAHYTLGDLVTIAGEAPERPQRSFCYAYHGDLDLLGHVYGPDSPAWREHLRFVDRIAEGIAARLPRDGLLAVTADHGMVAVREPDRIDADADPQLREGVRLIGGEVRARHVYAEAGATEEVAARWRDVLGERALVRTRDEAIAEGWFGPVSDAVRPRLGDVVVAMLGNHGVVRSEAEPHESAMIGQHGSLTALEQEVPLLVATG